MTTEQILKQLITRYPQLGGNREAIKQAGLSIIEAFRQGRQLLVCGNGGSSADADHIVSEMMKNFAKKRPMASHLADKLQAISSERGALLSSRLEGGLPTISLNAHAPLMTAISNDQGGDFIFAQQVMGYGRKGDALFAISTSGNSQNVIDACIVAKAKDMKVIALLGETGGKIKALADIAICVPATYTPDVQELHLPVYHALCVMAEEALF